MQKPTKYLGVLGFFFLMSVGAYAQGQPGVRVENHSNDTLELKIFNPEQDLEEVFYVSVSALLTQGSLRLESGDEQYQLHLAAKELRQSSAHVFLLARGSSNVRRIYTIEKVVFPVVSLPEQQLEWRFEQVALSATLVKREIRDISSDKLNRPASERTRYVMGLK